MTHLLTYPMLKAQLELSDPMTASDFSTILQHLQVEQDDTWIYNGDVYKETVQLHQLHFEDLTLAHLNLSGFDFSRATFHRVHFKDCILVRSVFDAVQMSHCSFERCNLTFAKITDASFEHTLFKNLNCYSSYFKWLTLKRCDWQLVQFRYGLLGNTDFSDCTWQEVRFLGGGEYTGLTFPKDFDASVDFSIA